MRSLKAIFSFPFQALTPRFARYCLILSVGFLFFAYPQPLPAAASYVLEVNGGLNFFTGPAEEIQQRYQLKRLTGKVGYVYNIRNGVLFLEHWLALFSFGYAKRQNFEYEVNAISFDQSSYEEYQHYHLSLGMLYYLFQYGSKWNIALGLSLGGVRNDITYTVKESVAANDGVISKPVVFKTYDFLLFPELKFNMRLRPQSVFYLGFQYSAHFPSRSHYPQLTLGIEIEVRFGESREAIQKRQAAQQLLEKIAISKSNAAFIQSNAAFTNAAFIQSNAAFVQTNVPFFKEALSNQAPLLEDAATNFTNAFSLPAPPWSPPWSPPWHPTQAYFSSLPLRLSRSAAQDRSSLLRGWRLTGKELLLQTSPLPTRRKKLPAE